MADRKIEYSTANPDGMEFISGRWVFTGDKGYRVQFVGGDGDRCWGVFSYAGAHTSPAYPMGPMTEDDAHKLAARLAGTTPHPVQG